MIVANSSINLNTKDIYGDNALHYAAAYGHLKIYRFLYKYGCPYVCALPSKNSPLTSACKGRHYDIVEEILEHNDMPMVDHQKNNGLTAMMIACKNGDANIVDHLLYREADPLIKTPQNVSAFYLACKHGYPE